MRADVLAKCPFHRTQKDPTRRQGRTLFSYVALKKIRNCHRQDRLGTFIIYEKTYYIHKGREGLVRAISKCLVGYLVVCTAQVQLKTIWRLSDNLKRRSVGNRAFALTKLKSLSLNIQ